MRCSDIEFDSSWPSSAVVRLNSNPIMDDRGSKLVTIRLAITVFEIVQKCAKVCLKVQTKTIVSPVHVSIVGKCCIHFKSHNSSHFSYAAYGVSN